MGIEIVKVTENRLKSHIVKMADSFRKMPVGDLLQTAISFFLINIFSNGFQFCIQLEKTLLLMYVTTLSDEKQNLVAGRYFHNYNTITRNRMQTFLFTYLSREINYFSFKKYKFWYFLSDNFVVKKY